MSAGCQMRSLSASDSANAPQSCAAKRSQIVSANFSSPADRAETGRARRVALSLSAFLEPGRAVAVRAPQSAAFPAAVRIVDPSIQALGIEAERIGNPDHDHLAVLQRHESVAEIGGGDRDVLAPSGRVVLVAPGVIAPLDRLFAE